MNRIDWISAPMKESWKNTFQLQPYKLYIVFVYSTQILVIAHLRLIPYPILKSVAIYNFQIIPQLYKPD